ncbi:PREDICTED: uncharacterized protein LOC102176024 isoform X2 [Capra hircus]|uniref:uncharacterized protein LOC102176024 isoform X2 n=1 Tax=Capra hircus TaxID=9925 RepID=UPI000846AD31|nr:PREDICTED: uncharacterized protein LOC102176024 isoform X2 [Capra hircus]
MLLRCVSRPALNPLDHKNAPWTVEKETGEEETSLRAWSTAQENLGPRRWSWYGWMDAPGMLSSSLSLTVTLSLRGSRPPPCEEPGPFLTSKPAASLASPHDPACNLLTEGRVSHTGTDGEDRSPECQQGEGDTHAAGSAGAQGLAQPRGLMGRALPTRLAVSISQKPLMVLC